VLEHFFRLILLHRCLLFRLFLFLLFFRCNIFLFQVSSHKEQPYCKGKERDLGKPRYKTTDGQYCRHDVQGPGVAKDLPARVLAHARLGGSPGYHEAGRRRYEERRDLGHQAFTNRQDRVFLNCQEQGETLH